MLKQFRLRLALLAPFAFSYVQPGAPLTAASVFAFGVGLWSPRKAIAGETPHSTAWRVQLKRFAVVLASTTSVVGTLALSSWFIEDTATPGAVVCALLIALPLLVRSRPTTLIACGASLALTLGSVLAGMHAWVLALLLAAGFLQGLVVEYATPLTARARTFLLASAVLYSIGVGWHQMLDPRELVLLLAFGLATAALAPTPGT